MTKILQPLLALAILLALLTVITTVTLADDTTFYPYDDSYMYENICLNNYGSSTWLFLSNYGEWDQVNRAVIKIDDQTGGGTVTSVLLKLWYGGYYEEDPNGLDVRVYRLTREFTESGVSWCKYDGAHYWTTDGGDYTSTAYATAELDDTEQWVTWNITTMALYEWNQSDDLYVLVRWRYENKTFETMSQAYFRSAEGPSAYRPQVIVTFEEEAQVPDVTSDLDAYGDLWADIQISPTLYDWTTATVYAQCSLTGQSTWTYESTGQAITVDDPVIERVTGLAEGTAYDYRAKLVYDTSEIVYSSTHQVTTIDYALPVFDSDHTAIGLHQATLWGTWTGNTDAKSIDARVYWKEHDASQWHIEEWKEGSGTTGDKSWTVDELYGNTQYDYKVEFDIDGLKWWIDPAEFTTGDLPVLTPSINDHGFQFVEVKIIYDCKDCADADIWARVQADGSSQWLTSTTNEGNTGEGTLYFTIDDLQAGTYYEYQGIVECEGITGTFGNQYFWSEDLETLPTLGDILSQFDRPSRLRIGTDITIGDTLQFNPTFEVMLKESGTEIWFTAGKIDVRADGYFYIDVVCGDLVKWDTSYQFYGIVDYLVGTIETDVDGLHVPGTPTYVETLQPAFVDDDSIMMQVYVQLADDLAEAGGTYVRFAWWRSGETNIKNTQWIEVLTTGIYQWELGPLHYGINYCYQGYLAYGAWLADPVVCARPGYWSPDDDDDDDDGWWSGLPGLDGLLPGGFPITAAKAIFALVCIVAAGGLIMWKLRNRNATTVALVAMLGGVLIFGMIRFIPLWFILLLAMIIGLGFLYVLKGGLAGGRE